MKTLSITINSQAFNKLNESDAPLFEQCQGQGFEALLLLDEDGVCTLDSRAPWENASPEAEWHGCTRTWTLPANGRGDTLHELLTDENTIELLQRVHNGRSIEWDGNNFVGVLDDDAADAECELTVLFDRLSSDESACWPVWEPGEWLQNSSLIELWPEGRTLAQAAAVILDEAFDQGVLCGDADDVEAELLKRLEWELEHDETFEPTKEQRAARKV